ncbi:uncharacterized protein phf11 isoform X2 [Sphaeramia orbicularis]|uniref:uncharacterized protein phf11 isoform X2 n=1 Tax=Sphaeramia orbicularis TaxID=375764 RepID=UPI0011801D46|nr:PHD finger protein 11 isoform X2 [Sphaeramia orbicularis]
MSVNMNPSRKVACILCQRSEETKITGALSTKGDITAHQNCLLFSSGIYCQNSPQFDDLFGFSVEDVANEVKRGNKLICKKCKKKGATVGCEVKRCKKSYHYPCAVEERAKSVEDETKGHYKLYCLKHYEQERNNSLNGINASSSKKSSKAASDKFYSHKVYCPTCKNTEGSILLENLDNNLIKSYCVNHAPSSSKNKNGGSSVYSSASDSSSSTKHIPYKRQHSFDDEEEVTPSKRNFKGWTRRMSDDSTNSELGESDKEPMSIFAPLDSDLEENANSVPKGQFIRKHSENSSGPALGNECVDESRNKNEDETIILSDGESESLLLPVETCMSDSTNSTISHHSQPVAVPSVASVRDGPSKKQGRDKSPEPVNHPGKHTCRPPESSKAPPSSHHSSPYAVTDSHPQSSSSAAPPKSTAGLPACATQPLDSTSFWKWCNTAGCTEAIFTSFINEMTAISRRIQSDQATQEDYDVALKVMKGSGKLGELVAKQQEELKKKQEELQQAAAALDEVASALRKSHRC